MELKDFDIQYKTIPSQSMYAYAAFECQLNNYIARIYIVGILTIIII